MRRTGEWVFLDGEFVHWDDAKIHVRSQGVLRGANVLEGVAAYWNETESQLYVRRLDDHIRRLADSMAMMNMAHPHYPPGEIGELSLELLRRNNFRENAHFLPMIYSGSAEDFSFSRRPTYTGIIISAVARGKGFEHSEPLTAGVASWSRAGDNVIPSRVKAGGNYQASRLVMLEAERKGYDIAIWLNGEGKVSEAANASLFVVRDGVLVTPDINSDILEGITRDTIMVLAREQLKVPVVERRVDRTELYVSQEIFVCGTGSEIIPIKSVDGTRVGNGAEGHITRELKRVYMETVTGETGLYEEWRTPVY
jgi:branched-chain amino acid aminotransferase